MDICDFLPYLKSAALRSEPGATDHLEKLAREGGVVGSKALSILGEIRCTPGNVEFNPRLVVWQVDVCTNQSGG